MKLNIAWWNCNLSPPLSKFSTQDNEITDHFKIVLEELLVKNEADIIGLCEVNKFDNIKISKTLSELHSNFNLLCLYEKEGNAVSDFALIYNKFRFEKTEESRSLNIKAPITREYLKAGTLVPLRTVDDTEINLILCHWQSRQTYPEGNETRSKLGQALRTEIDKLYDKSESSIIVILGDFNDEPHSQPIEQSLFASRDPFLVRSNPRFLYNPFWNCLGSAKHNIEQRHVGSCIYENIRQITHSKTFDQIILSSHFVSGAWDFIEGGAKIIHEIQESIPIDFEEISDHYPVITKLTRK